MNANLRATAFALGVLATAGATSVRAQQNQNAIPDAPKPQVTAIGPVAPGKGTASASTSSQPVTADDTNDNQPPARQLPGTPASPATPAAAEASLPDTDPGQAPEGQIYTAVLNSRFVDIPFTVKDSKGQLVPGLDWRDVRVYENDVRQHISVWTVDPFPMSVALVIDQTLPFDVMTKVNNALAAIQGAFAPYDEVSVFTYTNQVKKQDDFDGGQTARLGAIIERSKSPGREPVYYNQGEALSRSIDINNGAQDHINPLTAGGPGSPQGVQQVQREVHPLNDAILTAAKSLRDAQRGRRRIVYVISDGKEYGSQAKTKDVIHYLQENQIAVYATIVGDSSLAGIGFLDKFHLPLTIQDNILPRYATATGGQAYADFRQGAIEKSFAKITEQVRSQYTVGYYSRESALDGKFRKIEVKVLKPNLSIIAKAGYYPQAAPVRPRPVAAAAAAATPPATK